MSRFKRFSVSLFVSLFLVSSVADAKYWGPVGLGAFGAVGLGSAVTMFVLSLPPNLLHPSSYAPADWVVKDYVAKEEDCSIGCRSSIFQDQPEICVTAPYTAHVKGAYVAVVSDKNVTETAERHRICGNTADEAIADAQSFYPPGSAYRIYYNRNNPSDWVDGSPAYLLLTMSVFVGAVSVVVIATSVYLGIRIKRLGNTAYSQLETVTTDA